MVSKIVKIFTAVVGWSLLALLAIFFIREATALPILSRSGGIGSYTRLNSDSSVVFQSVDSADFVAGPVPHVGDTLIAVADSSAVSDMLTKYFGSPNPPGMQVGVTYLYQGDTLTATVKTSPQSKNEVWSVGGLMVLRCLLSLSFLAVGLWTFVKRPDSGTVRALALFCFAMSGFMVSAIGMGVDAYAAFTPPLLTDIVTNFGNFTVFFGAFWLNLHLLFPTPRRVIVKHPVWTYGICYGSLLIFLPLNRFLNVPALGTALILVVALQVSAGFFLLGKRHYTTNNPLEKRQTRLVLWGSGVGLSGMLILLLIALFSQGWFASLPEGFRRGIIVIVFVGLLLSPLSFAYAIGKYRLLEVEGRIRRGTRHLLITLALLVVLYGLVFFISEFTMNILGVVSRAPVLIAALLIAVGFAPIQRRVLTLLDKWIYPERARLKGMLNDFLDRSHATTDKRVFWTELEDKLRTALKVDSVYPVLRAAGNGHFEHWTGTLTPFEKGSDFIHELSRMGGRPVMRDELEASRRTAFRRGESDWLNANHVALILPMITRTELIGFLGISSKAERTDFEPADFEILRSLANQIAVATDNILLLEENVEKKRMEAELSIARKVQEGMLPHDIPNTPGLQVAARSLFCTEVAGDYYDVIELGDGRTALAIGDVSGKGAGAALLMSNVQASLRTAIDVGEPAADGSAFTPQRVDLSRIVRNINQLIHRNSQPDQFITFFVAIYDPKQHTLEYVNAGHNPPLVTRRSGDVEELLEGGLLLGALPDMVYDQGTIALADGDVVFLYTDGLSEAADADDAMFGEERIKRFLSANRSLSPDGMLGQLETEVTRFVGGAHLTDDFTLVAAVVRAEVQA
jgi:serine phosphatase RsbU (regulator of sigma subunit)